MEDLDPVRHWAMVKRSLKEAYDSALKAHGMTWESLRELELQADSAMQTQDTVETEYGVVRRVGRPAFLHKDSKKIGETFYLTLDRKPQ